MTARALRATERSQTGKSPLETPTEILDSSALPDLDDEEAVVAKDPRRRTPIGEDSSPTVEMPKLAAPEDARAEKLMESFIAAAHERAKKPEEPPKREPSKPVEPPKKEAQKPPEPPKKEAQRLAETKREIPKPPEEAKREPPKPPEPRQATPPAQPRPPGAAARPALPPRAPSAPSAPRPRVVIPPPQPGRGGALSALDQAQPPGVFFHEHAQGEHREEDEDPALASAVDDAIGQLFGVRGIHHIGPGQNELGEPVVVIAAGEDFGEAAFNEIPETVGDFQTLVTLPFDLLPLRKNR